MLGSFGCPSLPFHWRNHFDKAAPRRQLLLLILLISKGDSLGCSCIEIRIDHASVCFLIILADTGNSRTLSQSFTIGFLIFSAGRNIGFLIGLLEIAVIADVLFAS